MTKQLLNSAEIKSNAKLRKLIREFMESDEDVPEKVFDHLKAVGDVGVPAFVFEDGRVSVDPADAGLIEYGTTDASSAAEK